MIASTESGTGQIVVVEGEAGIGKTHLIREATTLARAANLTVLEVAADEVLRRPGTLPRRTIGERISAGVGRGSGDQSRSPERAHPNSRECRYSVTSAGTAMWETVA